MKIELRKETDPDFKIWYRVYCDDKYMFGSAATSSAKEYYDNIVKIKGILPSPIVLESVEVNPE